MRSLSDVSLSDILPANLTVDPFVAALIPVFDEEFHLLVADTGKILLFQALSSQPDSVLDELAWQFGVDFYDQAMTATKKRAFIAEAIYLHSIKGTPYAVDRLIEIVLGEGTITEWFEYGGSPFRFRLTSMGTSFLDAGGYTSLLRMIRVVKRASAILERITIGQSVSHPLFFGGAMHIGQHITLGSA